MDEQIEEKINDIQLPDDYRFRMFDLFRNLDVDSYLSNKLDERIKFNVLCNASNPKYKENRAIAYNLAKEDFCFFANYFAWIQNPRADERKKEYKDIPFVLYPFQEYAAKEIIKAIEDGNDIPIEKSRDMGLSWLLITIFVWGWHFHGWDLLVGSQKFENVDMVGNVKSLMGKARYVIERMPGWMRPKLVKKVHDKTGLLIHPGHGATLAGESNNTNFGRSDRRKAILFDEFSSWILTDSSAWQSCSSTTLCRIPLSTPNTRGTNCYFYQVLNNAKKKGLPFLTLHWCLHPVFSKGLYVDEIGNVRSPWYDNELQRATDISQAHQELDINFEASMSGKVFPGFTYEQNVRDDVKYDDSLPLYVGFDFGLDATALVFANYNHLTKTLYIFDEYENNGTTKEGSDIMHYVDILNSKPYRKPICYGDPFSGESRNLAARGMSNAGILRREGYIFKCKRTKVQNRIAAARNMLPRIVISPKCSLLIDSLSSWQMIKPRSGNTSSSVPEHNEYSHICDALSYLCWMLKVESENRNYREDSGIKYEQTISGVML